jgi:hypothetical protein
VTAQLDGTLIPPYEVSIVDADDEFILTGEWDFEKFTAMSGDDILRAVFPVTVTIRDKQGNEWEQTWSPPEREM